MVRKAEVNKKDLAVKINWKKYLSQYDLVYDGPSRVWEDGLALGNGSLSAIAYESEGFYPEWTMNKNDVWDYRHPQFNRHSMDEVREIAAKGKNYLKEMNKENVPDTGLGKLPGPRSCGQLRIRFGKEKYYTAGHKITKRLGLHEATLHTNLDKHLSHLRISSFVSANENVMVIKVRDVSTMVAFNNKVDLFRKHDVSMPPVKTYAQGDTMWLDQSFHDGLRFVMMARIVPKGGGKYREIFRETVDKIWWDTIKPSTKIDAKTEGDYGVAQVAGDFDVYLTVVTSLEAKDPQKQARKQLSSAVANGLAKLQAEHRRWWSKFWTKSYIGLDEPLLEQLWYLSKYNLGSALRGTPIWGLCGPWFGSSGMSAQILPWMGHYTNDYNMQLPVMPTFRINHPELAEGSFRTLLQQLPSAKENAQELYDLPGAFYPLGTDPSGKDITNAPYRFCQNSGPYWGVFLWWHYLYTKDKEFLKNVSYPIMREVATFFTNYMTWHEDEKLYHLEISQNPELMYIKYPDPIDTLVMLKYTLSATIKAGEILGRDKKLSRKCQHVLDHYPSYPQHENGFSPLRGLRPDHIHHERTLAGLFPTGEFDPEAFPQWGDVCHKEVNDIKWNFMCHTYACKKGSMACWTGPAYHHGMALCRLGLKDRAWKQLEDILKGNVKPNGMISTIPAVLVNSELSEKNINNA